MILDLADQLALLVLDDALAKVTTKPPQQRGQLVLAAAADVQAAQDREAAPVFQLVVNILERGGQARQREIVARETGPGDAVGAGHGGHRGVQFGAVAGRQAIFPTSVGGQIGGGPNRAFIDGMRRFDHVNIFSHGR